jgi:predicted amidohydrolase
MNHVVRVAALQYFVRPVTSFSQFSDQVEALAATARDYRCRLLVFPEYFTVQLLTLAGVKRPIDVQIRELAGQVDAFVELMAGLAKRSGLYIVAGTIPVLEDGRVFNQSFFFSPHGASAFQRKIHTTRFESEEWDVSSGSRLRVFETDFGVVAIAICYDIEFPELSRAAAMRGAQVLVVPSCTDDRMGFLRVRYCAHARAVENQCYVVCSSTVGSLPMVPAVSLNWGQAGILTPCDFAFARDGVLAEGSPNLESMVIGDLRLDAVAESRRSGTVLPLRDSRRTAEVHATLETVKL